MDFQKLMTLAIQNKARDEKQQEMKKVALESKGGRLNNQRLPQAALHAHLAKREDLTPKAAKKDSARLVRVQVRLPQSPSRNKPPESKTVARGIQQRGKDETNPGRSSHQQLPISSAANNGKKEKTREKIHWSHRKGVEFPSSKRQVESKRNTLVKNSDNRKAALDNPKCLQGSAKKCSPMTFEALIAVAAKNKDGTSQTNERKFNTQYEISKSSIQNSQRLKSEERKPGNKTNNFHGTSEDRTTTKGNRGWSIEKRKQSEIVSKKSLNQSKAVPPKLSPLEVRCQSTGKNGKSVNSHVINQGRTVSSSERYPDQQRGKESKKRKRDPLVDGMEDFIDDADVDDVDVSKYIKEIFGYDKARYYDDGEDLSNMESNYARIEREEVKSSRIARLEDEIEHLKELAELKKEKQKLKKRLKT